MAVLELRDIAKHFGAIEALKGVDVDLEAGEVLGLMGDNGAGKSTLVKIIAGNFPPSDGEIRLEGRTCHFHRPIDARAEGIEVVYQDLALCDNLTAAANVFLGREAKKRFGPFRFLDYARHVRPRRRAVRRAQVRDPAARPGAADVGRPAPGGGDRAHPPVGCQDRADGRADRGDQRPPGRRGARPDPPLAGSGIAIILISHRMPDVFAVCDRIAVLRRGRKVAEKAIAETSPEEVTGLITGAIASA